MKPIIEFTEETAEMPDLLRQVITIVASVPYENLDLYYTVKKNKAKKVVVVLKAVAKSNSTVETELYCSTGENRKFKYSSQYYFPLEEIEPVSYALSYVIGAIGSIDRFYKLVD